MRIIAVDPGSTTGFASCTYDPVANEISALRHGAEQIIPFWRGYHAAMTMDPVKQFEVTVYESWKLTAKGAKVLVGSDMPWSQLIGMMRASCILAREFYPARVLQFLDQPPAIKSAVNSWYGSERDWLPSSSFDHNLDAIRHLFYYLHKQKGVTLEHLATHL